MTFQLFTLNYKAFQPPMGTPVQTSNGKPRWPLPYRLDFAAPEIYPPWAIVRAKLDQDPFREKYRAALAAVGVDKIASRLRAIREGGGRDELVLLCFEDIAKPGWWCHRTMFADWWTEQTGDPVRELGPTGPPTPPAPEPTLF